MCTYLHLHMHIDKLTRRDESFATTSCHDQDLLLFCAETASIMLTIHTTQVASKY